MSLFKITVKAQISQTSVRLNNVTFKKKKYFLCIHFSKNLSESNNFLISVYEFKMSSFCSSDK